MKVKIKGEFNHVIGGKEYKPGGIVEIDPWQLSSAFYDVVDDAEEEVANDTDEGNGKRPATHPRRDSSK
jgi:hypothetical protein